MTTATDAVVHYRKESWRLLSQVDAELARGNLEAASQALWDAAAHGAKAAAAHRGWPYCATYDLMNLIVRLIEEENGSVDLNTNLIIAHSFDRRNRSWEIPIDEATIRYCKDAPVTELLKTLEGMD